MFNRSWFVPLLFGSLMACAPLIAIYANSVRSATQGAPASQPSTPTTPAKTTTIQVKGKPQMIPIDFVETSRFSTYFPPDRFALLEQSENKITLRWKNLDGTSNSKSSIDIYFYDKNTTVENVRQLVDADVGIAEYEGDVQRIAQSPAIANAKKTYSPWLRDVIRAETKLPNNDPRNLAITSYIGEVNGQVFLVFSTYRFRDADEFASREAVILKNLKVKNENK